MRSSHTRPRVTAVLGPTNTGKTHLAMERMLGHPSGMIGFPLRLLARENYDRAVRLKGPNDVALITGEEKIVPSDASYFLCTVESMPLGRRVAFLAVDEIQMCADPDRGHIFTDRLLHARGAMETMLLGAETIRPLLRRLVPDAAIETRARLSTLKHAGERKVQRLPRRTALVAFSTADVYALAEVIRRHRGGAGVVLGALSPRTRNAQVALYQAGEVDYLVATDAIGMGLNMDIDHVAFAATRKFDGRTVRNLTPAELAQIAGRAGRHMNNGTFGTTALIPPFDPEVALRIEEHRFDPLKVVHWRNTDLDLSSVAALQGSLSRRPKHAGLVRAREADDELALGILAREPEVAQRARGRAAVALLWEVCQIPDFQKVMSDAHSHLLAQIYGYLMGTASRPGHRLPTDWIAQHVARIDRTDGDIDTLMQRIAHIRTWTYVSHRSDWMQDAAHWQERTRKIEDTLSDALHDRLIQRFVDRRTALLVGRMSASRELLGAVRPNGEVLVEGEHIGMLEGFRFIPDRTIADERPGDSRNALRLVNAAALRSLRGEIARRVGRLESDDDEHFALTKDARVTWRGTPVARLVKGPDPLRPRVEPSASELLDAEPRERVRKRLARWLETHLEERLSSLIAARGSVLRGPARGLVFQMCEALGSMPRHRVATQLASLDAGARESLKRLGVRVGRESVYLPALLKPDAVSLRRILWSLFHETAPPPEPAAGRVSVRRQPGLDGEIYEAIGYRPLGPLAVRVDIVERAAAKARILSRHGAFQIDSSLRALLGCRADDVSEVLAALGYRSHEEDGRLMFRRGNDTPRKTARHGKRRRATPNEQSPFARLKEISPPG